MMMIANRSSVMARKRDKSHHLPSLPKKRTTGKKRTAADAEDSNQSKPKPKKKETVEVDLDHLLDKRGPVREKALTRIIEGLTRRFIEQDLLVNKFATVLYRGLDCLKKGSALEKKLSLHVIGLEALIVGCQDKLSEIYREFLPVVSRSLDSEPAVAFKMLDCLGIVGFFGADNSEETEGAMQIIWKFLNVSEKHSAEVLVSGIHAWMFLLASVEGWRLGQDNWNGAISYYLNLLEHEDSMVRVAASEALALIFETGSLDKFWSDAAGSDVVNYSRLQQLLREKVLEKLKSVYLEMKSNKNVGCKIRQVVEYFGKFRFPGASVRVNEKYLKPSSWCEMTQVQYLKRFLGDGFELHMKENEKLQRLFEFDPRRNRNSGPELYVPTMETISVQLFVPEERDLSMLTSEDAKKERVWRTSVIEKAKSQLMKKHRLVWKEMNTSDDFLD